MNIAWILLYSLIINGLKIVIFFKVDGISLEDSICVFDIWIGIVYIF